MHTNQLLAKLILIILVVECCILPLTSAADNQSVALPQRALGDEWQFTTDFKGEEGTFFNLTITVTAIGINNPSGNIDCFELTTVGSGIVYGTNVSGTAECLYKEHFGSVDYNLAEAYVNTTLNTKHSGLSNRISQTSNTIYNPPFGINMGFPLTVGKTWISNRTATTTAATDTDGTITKENSTAEQSTTFVVDRTETVTVPAGTFETYVLKATNADGSKMEIYYAPEAAMQIKEVDSDANGNVVATMELTGYHLAGSADTMWMYWAVAAGLAIAFALAGLAFVSLRQRKTKQVKPTQLANHRQKGSVKKLNFLFHIKIKIEDAFLALP